MTKMTTGQIYQAASLLKEIGGEKIDGVTCYRIAYLLRKKLYPICESFEATRNKLFEEFAIEDEDNNKIIPKDKKQIFIDEINKVASEEHDVIIELDNGKIIIDTNKPANKNFSFSSEKMMHLLDLVEVI